jgi:hypothetical protein
MMRKKNVVTWILVMLLVPVMSGFAQMDMGKMPTGKITKAICVLFPTQGNNVSGTVTFTQTEKGIKVVADLQLCRRHVGRRPF